MSALTKYENQGQQSLSELQLLAGIAKKSKCYGQKSEEELLMLLLTARDLGMCSTKALNSGFWIVQGKIIMSADLMRDMVRRAGHSIQVIEATKDSCTLKGTRKDNGDTLTVTFTLEMAKRAGLLKNAVWTGYPEDMLMANATKRLCKWLFSDVIGNAYDEYSMHDVIEKDKKWKAAGAPPFDGETIEVENAIPKLEQMPEEVEKPTFPDSTIEELHEALKHLGLEVEMTTLHKYISYIAEKRQRTNQDQINNIMSERSSIEEFKDYLERALAKHTAKEE